MSQTITLRAVPSQFPPRLRFVGQQTRDCSPARYQIPSTCYWQDLSSRVSDQVELSPELKPIVIRRMHAWATALRNTAGPALTQARLVNDGGKSRSERGLPTAPRMTKDLGGGRYLIEAVKFKEPCSESGQCRGCVPVSRLFGPTSRTPNFSDPIANRATLPEACPADDVRCPHQTILRVGMLKSETPDPVPEYAGPCLVLP
jgi:hypothetical protein